VARVLYPGTQRIEFVIVQQPSDPHAAPTDLYVGPFPAMSAAELPTQCAADTSTQSADRPAAGPRVRVGTHAIREVVVLEVGGEPSDVVEDLDHSGQLALAEGAHGGVYDRSAVLERGYIAAINPRNVHTLESVMSPTGAGKVTTAAIVDTSANTPSSPRVWVTPSAKDRRPHPATPTATTSATRPVTSDSRQSSAGMTATLLAEPEGGAAGHDLVADIVRGVLDESRHDSQDRTVESTMLEARRRLERFIRARTSK
jgi:hypothetical protein